MTLFTIITNESGKEVKIGGNESIMATLKHKNKVVGKLAFEMWGADTDEPFYALMWYPNGDLKAGEPLNTRSHKIQGDKRPAVTVEDITKCPINPMDC